MRKVALTPCLPAGRPIPSPTGRGAIKNKLSIKPKTGVRA